MSGASLELSIVGAAAKGRRRTNNDAVRRELRGRRYDVEGSVDDTGERATARLSIKNAGPAVRSASLLVEVGVGSNRKLWSIPAGAFDGGEISWLNGKFDPKQHQATEMIWQRGQRSPVAALMENISGDNYELDRTTSTLGPAARYAGAMWTTQDGTDFANIVAPDRSRFLVDGTDVSIQPLERTHGLLG